LAWRNTWARRACRSITKKPQENKSLSARPGSVKLPVCG
jgi:hypothetical protein